MVNPTSPLRSWLVTPYDGGIDLHCPYCDTPVVLDPFHYPCLVLADLTDAAVNHRCHGRAS
jgi:hypothetical protein